MVLTLAVIVSGKTGHHPDSYYSRKLTCHLCGKRGHIERACGAKSGSRVISRPGRIIHFISQDENLSGSEDSMKPSDLPNND